MKNRLHTRGGIAEGRLEDGHTGSIVEKYDKSSNNASNIGWTRGFGEGWTTVLGPTFATALRQVRSEQPARVATVGPELGSNLRHSSPSSQLVRWLMPHHLTVLKRFVRVNGFGRHPFPTQSPPVPALRALYPGDLPLEVKYQPESKPAVKLAKVGPQSRVQPSPSLHRSTCSRA